MRIESGIITCENSRDVATLETLFNSACFSGADVTKSPVYMLWCVQSKLTIAEARSTDAQLAFTRRAALAIADFWRKKCQNQN